MGNNRNRGARELIDSSACFEWSIDAAKLLGRIDLAASIQRWFMENGCAPLPFEEFSKIHHEAFGK